MPASRLVSAQHGIIAWSENADGDTAGLVVPTAILVRRSMEPTGRGAASDIGQPIPTVGAQATTTLSDGTIRQSPSLANVGYCYRVPNRPFGPQGAGLRAALSRWKY